MNISWFIGLWMYAVGGVMNGNNFEVFFCSEAGCNRQFYSRSGRSKHFRRAHANIKKVFCMHGCGKCYDENSLKLHQKTCDRIIPIGYGIQQQHYTTKEQSLHTGFYLKKSAHDGNYKLFRDEAHATSNIQSRLRHAVRHDIKGIIQRIKQNIKFIVTISCVFEKTLRPGIYTIPPAFFKSSPIRTVQAHNLEEIVNGIFEDLWAQIENYVQNGSGWCLRKLLNIDLEVCYSSIHFSL